MYIPKNRVITNLQSNKSDSFMYKDTKESFVGLYYKTYDGKFYAGNPDVNARELIKDNSENIPNASDPVFSNIVSNSNLKNEIEYDTTVLDYSNIKNINQSESKKLPYLCSNIPTEEDYINGKYTRYFVKKVNSNDYIEVNKEIYNKINSKDKEWLFELYITFKMEWYLKGYESVTLNQNSVFTVQKNININGLDFYLSYNFRKFVRNI